MSKWASLFGIKTCRLFGMIHLKPLPGSPQYNGSFNEILDSALYDAEIYKNSGVDGIIVENMHDIPYVKSTYLLPETTAVMAAICTEVRKILPKTIKCGVQVLAGGNKEAIAIALASGFQFTRAEGYVFSHVGDEGTTESCAGDLLRYRRYIMADDILVLTDVKKKHCAHAITADVSLQETVNAAEFFLSDGVIITGAATGAKADLQDLKAALSSATGPVLVGSGVTVDNVADYLSADGLIVGSHFKHHGRWQNKLDKERINIFMETFKRLQQHN